MATSECLTRHSIPDVPLSMPVRSKSTELERLQRHTLLEAFCEAVAGVLALDRIGELDESRSWLRLCGHLAQVEGGEFAGSPEIGDSSYDRCDVIENPKDILVPDSKPLRSGDERAITSCEA